MRPLPTLRQLQFFVALNRRQSFSRAAEDNLVSQSTLSAGIKELEATLGTALIDRTSRPFALTAIGEEVARRAERLLADAEDLSRAAQKRVPLTGAFHLGVIPTIAPFLLPLMMEEVEEQFPDLNLYLREGLTEDLLDQLHTGKLDMALMAFPYESPDIETLIFGEDTFHYACAPDHPFAQRKMLKPEEIDPSELLLLEDGHCLRDHALSACARQSPQNANAFGATSLFTLVQMVRSRLGATLLPAMAIRAGLSSNKGVVSIPVRGKPAPSRQIGFAWRKGSDREAEAEALATILRPKLRP